MDNLLWIAMSGAKENFHSLAVRSNNLANASTTGFKADFENSRAMSVFADAYPTRAFAMTERPGYNMDGGAIETTDRPLDVALNGDGSLLHAARALVKYNTPVLGVNRGRLGFLTDIKPAEVLFKLDQVLKGDFQLDRRFLLEMEVRSNNQTIYDAIALNDVVLHSGRSVHMIDFELNIDGQYVYRQHSDGLIVSTPTGSTAYALSGGGPILHPSMDAIALVPMHPHTLSSRPIVVGGHSEIKIQIRENRVLPMVSADGQHSISLNVGDSLHIRKHPFKLILLHPPGYDFYMACRTKLGWNQDFDSFQQQD